MSTSRGTSAPGAQRRRSRRTSGSSTRPRGCSWNAATCPPRSRQSPRRRTSPSRPSTHASATRPTSWSPSRTPPSPKADEIPLQQRPELATIAAEPSQRQQLAIAAALSRGMLQRISPVYALLRDAAAADGTLREHLAAEIDRRRGFQRTLVDLVHAHGPLRDGPHRRAGGRDLFSTGKPRPLPPADQPPRLDTRPIPGLARRHPPAPPPAGTLRTTTTQIIPICTSDRRTDLEPGTAPNGGSARVLLAFPRYSG